MAFLLLWAKAHVVELLHHVLLWHWAWLTFRRAHDFTVLSVEHSANLVLFIVWCFSIWGHFRKRLCNKKTVRAEV